MIVLEGRDLAKRYSRPSAAVEALRGVSFHLEAGEILGIAGESGSGKSTLLRLVAGLEPPSGGTLSLHGRPLGHRRSREEYRQVQMVFQDAAASFNPRRTILDSTADAVRSLLGRGARVDAEALSAMVNLDPALMARYPRQLSGGQCQRFAIARAMAVQPEILLCDEITSALDVSSQAQILRLLADLCRRKHTSAIFVSHDLAVLGCLCDRVMVLRGGSVVEQGDTGAVIRAPKEDYTRMLVESVLQI